MAGRAPFHVALSLLWGSRDESAWEVNRFLAIGAPSSGTVNRSSDGSIEASRKRSVGSEPQNHAAICACSTCDDSSSNKAKSTSI